MTQTSPPTSELPRDEAGAAPSSPAVSVVVPVYDEVDSLRGLAEELTTTLDELGRPWEAIFVDDGSTDGSGPLLDELCAARPELRAVHFRRNYGQTAALMAGFDLARGEVLVPLDADRQNDPRDIPRLLQKLDEGYDVVSGWRKDRQDAFFRRRLPSAVANRLISRVSGVPLHDYGCTLKAYRRRVLEGVRLYGEMHRFVPIFAHLQGGKVTELEVSHRAREHGRSKYGLLRIFKVLLDLLLVTFLTQYGAKPIYLFGAFSLACFSAGVLSFLASVVFKLLPEDTGWQKDFVETPLPILAAVCVLVSVIALLQGLLSELLMRTYFESQGKVPYTFREPPSD